MNHVAFLTMELTPEQLKLRNTILDIASGSMTLADAGLYVACVAIRTFRYAQISVEDTRAMMERTTRFYVKHSHMIDVTFAGVSKLDVADANSMFGNAGLAVVNTFETANMHDVGMVMMDLAGMCIALGRCPEEIISIAVAGLVEPVYADMRELSEEVVRHPAFVLSNGMLRARVHEILHAGSEAPFAVQTASEGARAMTFVTIEKPAKKWGKQPPALVKKIYSGGEGGFN